MKIIRNNQLSIPSFSIENVKGYGIEDKSIIERLVKNMVLIESGIYLENIYDIKSFDGTLISKSNPKAVEIESFYISKFLVSEKEWALVMKCDSSEYNKNLPVYGISYEDSLRFIANLNSITGLKFDLPTSFQWDYAAHGGRTNNYHLEDKTYAEIADCAWINPDSPFPIGLKEPNTLGLYDMFGNIGELCKRIANKDIVKGGGVCSERIYTGDVINGYSIYNYHDYWSEKYVPSNIGFRLVCNEVDIKSLL